MEFSRRQREFIGRGTMLIVLGILPLWGGFKCIGAGRMLAADFEKRHEAYPQYDRDKDSSGSFLPYCLAAVLLLPGTFFTLAAVLPIDTFAKVIGPPRKNRLWDNPEAPSNTAGHYHFWDGW